MMQLLSRAANGLSAAVRLAEKGKKVRVLEAETAMGGAARSGQLTLPGYIHDFGSAILAISVHFEDAASFATRFALDSFAPGISPSPR